MRNWRDLNRKALGTVHKQFGLPAVYLTRTGATQVPLRVRLHRKNDQSQPSGGDWSDGAAMLDLSDRIIFQASDVQGVVLNSSYVIFSADEGYMTGSSWPERRGFIAVNVVPMTRDELSRLFLAVDTEAPQWAEVLPEVI